MTIKENVEHTLALYRSSVAKDLAVSQDTTKDRETRMKAFAHATSEEGFIAELEEILMDIERGVALGV